jgi:hypothetical protein
MSSKSAPSSFSIRRVALGLAFVLISCSTLAAIGFGIFHAWSSPPSFARLTSDLPDCDRIELELVKGSEEQILQVYGSKVLTGNDASAFGRLWRSEHFIDGPGDMCHSPIYRLRFYRQKSLFSEATICFGCANIYFLRHSVPDETEIIREIAFNPQDPLSLKLRAYLTLLLPPNSAVH